MKSKLLFLFLILTAPILVNAQVVGETPVHQPEATDDGSCFSLDFAPVPFAPEGQACVEVSLVVNGFIGIDNPVTISDDMGNTLTCSNDCSVVWCYNLPSPVNWITVNFTAETKFKSNFNVNKCIQKESQIILVGP